MKKQEEYIAETLEFISQNGYSSNYELFLKDIAKFLSELLSVKYVLITKYSLKTPQILESVAFFGKQDYQKNIKYNIEGTPCENVVNNKVQVYPNNVQNIFPEDTSLVEMNVNSYIGVPLWGLLKNPIGLISILDSEPITEAQLLETVLKIISIKVEKVLEKMLFDNVSKQQIIDLDKLSKKTKESEESILISNEKFSKAFYDHPAAMQIVNIVSGDRIDANESYLKLFEVDSNEDFIKGNIFKNEQVINPEIIKLNINKLKTKGSFKNSDFKILSKSGNLKYLLASGSMLDFEDGNMAILSFIDVTAQKESEEKYKLLSNLTFEGILIHKNGIAIDINAAFAKMFGYSRNELIGKNVIDLLFTNKSHELIRKYKNKTGLYKIEGIKKNGIIFPVEVQVKNANSDKKGEVRVASIRDITQRIEFENTNKKLLAAVEQSGNSIVITDKNGKIEYTNPKFTEVTGYSAKETLGENPKILKSGIQSKEYYEEMWQTITQGKVWEGEFQNKTKSGNVFWEKATITPVKNGAGEIINYLAIKEDITNRKRSEEDLKTAYETIKEKENYLSKILKTANEGFWIINNERITLRVNEEMCNILGYEEKEVLGKSIFEFVDKENSAIFSQEMKKRDKGLSTSYEISLQKKNGNNVPCLFNTSPIFDNENKQTGSFALVTNISQLKATYKKLESINTELRKLSFELSEKNRLHLESNNRFKNLFELSPVSLWEEDYSLAIKLLNEKKEEVDNLEDYLDENPDFVIECIKKIDIISVNQNTLELFKANNKEELIIQLRKTLDSKAIEVLKNELLAVISEKKEFKTFAEFLRVDGKELTTILKLAKIDNRGKVIVSITDITALKEAEKELLHAKQQVEKSDERYALAVSATNLGIWDWDVTTNQVYYSKLWKAQLGYEENELGNKFNLWENYLHPDDFKEKTLYFENYFKNPKGQYISEFRLKHKNGSYIWVHSRAEVLKNEKGEVIRMFGSHRDITTLKKTQLELQEQNEKLIIAKEKAEESDHLKTEFLNNMSHEIRTPMNGILGFSQMLSEPNLDIKKRNNFVNIIQNSGNQLLQIIDDILEISKLGTKQVKVIDEEVCLNDVLLELFSIFDIKAKENRTPLYLKKSLSDKQSTITTDKTKLNKILGNLIENALKFTSTGFIEFGYRLKNVNEQLLLEIYVKDTGIGIKEEYHEQIFERFAQAEKELTKKVGGLGLGLSIAKENTELLGGKISLNSQLNGGSTFFITIPFTPVYDVEEDLVISDKITILIAEDEEVNFMFLETILNDKMELNCNIFHAKNGVEAVELCENHPEIDVILMDLKMPILNGFKATSKIREFRPNVPIIAQTAYSTIEDKEKAFQAGCNDFISKPIDKDLLKDIIDKNLICKNEI